MPNARRQLARHAAVRSAAYRILRARALLARGGAPPRVLVNTFPKAGSHLLTSALDQFADLRPAWLHLVAPDFMPGDPYPPDDNVSEVEALIDWRRLRVTLQRAKSGQYATSHLLPFPSLYKELDALGYRVVFGFRDPRDIVVSAAAYLSTLPRHPQFRRYTEKLTTPEERMIVTLRGAHTDRWGPGFPSLGGRLWAYVPWLQAEQAVCCRFEDLVGARGGGSDDAQLAAIRSIAEHLNRPLDDEDARRVASKAWSTKTATFRSGQIGGWRTKFTPLVHEAFADEVGDALLLAYGYTPEA